MTEATQRWIAAVLGVIAVVLICYRILDYAPDDSGGHLVQESVAPPGALRVLFVGNSHTITHDVPELVRRIAVDGSTPIAFTMSVSAGRDLVWHAEQGEVARLLKQSSFDIVVLQPQGIEAIWQPDRFADGLHSLEDEAAKAGIRVLVWEMWARDPTRDAYAVYQEPWGGRDLADQTRRLAESTRRAAKDAEIAPIGAAWLEAHHRLPGLELHSDGSHATLAGAYLTALILYGALVDEPLGKVSWSPEGVPEDIARELRLIAADTLDAER